MLRRVGDGWCSNVVVVVEEFRRRLPHQFGSSCSSRVLKNNSSSLFVVPKMTNTAGGGFTRLFGSMEFLVTSSSTEEEDDDGYDDLKVLFEAIEQGGIDVVILQQLSLRELQLLLVYFSQQGRDCWCALEIFDWLRKQTNHVLDHHTVDLMTSIMCAWLQNTILSPSHTLDDVLHLLLDMDCVGLKPTFPIIQNIISLYWDHLANKDDCALNFVTELSKRAIPYHHHHTTQGGATGYLAWKMMVDGNYMGSVKLVIDLKESGLKPEVYSYLIAMTAVIKELNEFSKALRKLKGFIKAGLLAELDAQNVAVIEKYQTDLVSDGVRLSNWVIEGSTVHSVLVHERLLAMYICVGRGLMAEQQLWEMKLAGKEPDRELYDIVLAICACQKEMGAVARLLTGMEVTSSRWRKKTLLWLLKGYVKGGHFQDASKTIMKMLDMGLCPEYLDRAAVLQGLRKSIQESSGNVEPYLKLCERLSDANLIGPCLVYAYMDRYRLWLIKMI